MEKGNFSEQESLKLINEMISKAKASYVTKGIASIAWGLIIFLCSMATWAKVQFEFDPGFDIWFLTVAAIIPQIWYSAKEKKKKSFTGYTDVVMDYVWATFGISIFVLCMYNGAADADNSTALFMMLYAMPTFITGGICKFKPMIIGGIFCWAASIISLYTPVDIDLLLMAACGLLAWFIPGIILWKIYQKGRRTHV